MSFGGVCAECPNHPRNRLPSPGDCAESSTLPPLAAEAITALARCRHLTAREREVLTLCCRGLKTSAMAVTLGISVSAVRRHLRNLHHKTCTADKTELILNLWHSCGAWPNGAD